MCLICADFYKRVSELVTHLLDHDEHDVNLFGMTRYILARADKDVCDAQEQSLKVLDRDFRMSMHRSTHVQQSQHASSLPDLLLFCNQLNILSKTMDLLHGDGPVITPPWTAGKEEAHAYSDHPYTERSFRISDAFLQAYGGPVQDILTLSSLTVRRGLVGGQALYKVTDIQRSS